MGGFAQMNWDAETAKCRCTNAERAIRKGSEGGMIWGDPNYKVSSFAIKLITNFVGHGFETGVSEPMPSHDRGVWGLQHWGSPVKEVDQVANCGE